MTERGQTSESSLSAASKPAVVIDYSRKALAEIYVIHSVLQFSIIFFKRNVAKMLQNKDKRREGFVVLARSRQKLVQVAGVLPNFDENLTEFKLNFNFQNVGVSASIHLEIVRCRWFPLGVKIRHCCFFQLTTAGCRSPAIFFNTSLLYTTDPRAPSRLVIRKNWLRYSRERALHILATFEKCI